MTVEGIPPCTSVLYLTASAEIGGGNRSLVALWAGLRKTAGVRVMVVCPSDGPMVGLCRELGMCCEVHEYQQTSWRQPLCSWRGWRSWCDVLGRARADLVHANSLDGARSILPCRTA